MPDPSDTSTSRVAWFHCFSGIAGDMAMGALIDAGADIDEVRALCERLPIGGWALEAEATMRTGIGAVKVHVHAEPSTVVRTAAHISGMVEEARLPDRVRRRALATFDALARAEGHLHRRPPESVHFHEVGGIDAIVDVVGTCAALELLGIDEVDASPVAQGIGMVRSAHGMLPIPVPAVVELLRGAPTYQLDVPIELTTPTGAALLAALVTEWGPMPGLTIDRTGFGAGTADLGERPNLVQVVIGDRSAELTDGQPVVLLEANIDDATGETLAHAIAELLSAGAHDAWLTPILMKKGRPAYTVSALADEALAGQIARVLANETGSLGVRGQTLQRWPQARSAGHVEVEGRAVRVKVSAGRVKVEHDDAARVARQVGMPLREVVSLAEEAWRSSQTEQPDGESPALSAISSPERPVDDATVAPIGHLHDGHERDHDPDHSHDH
ncbi:MAG: nickel pincer cofactor biosynthesis protein LarC [Acidimicrobiales bacterium]